MTGEFSRKKLLKADSSLPGGKVHYGIGPGPQGRIQLFLLQVHGTALAACPKVGVDFGLEPLPIALRSGNE